MTLGSPRHPSAPPGGTTPFDGPADPDEAPDRLRLRRVGPLGDGARRDDGWLDDLDEDRPPRRGLVALAVLPWLVVVALLVLPGRLGQAPADVAQHQGAPASEAVSEDPAPTPTPTPRSDPAGTPRTVAPDGLPVAPLSTASGQQAAALATIVARAWLTGVEPVLEVGGAPPPDAARYAEHLVVESVLAPDPDAAVVTLLAVVLEGEGWLDARVLRLAVPVALDDGEARSAGPPWVLPGPSLTAVTPDVDRIEDPDVLLAARDALGDAGFADVDLLGLGDTGGWPVIAYLDDPSTPEVWLQPVGDGFVVAGRRSAEVPEEDAP